MAATVDGTSPVLATGTPSNGGTVVTASFTAPANSVLVVEIAADGSTADNGTVGHVVTDSGGLTWTKQVERLASEATDGGTSAIWTAVQTTSAARTVTVTRSQTLGTGLARRVAVKVYVVQGADIGGTIVDTVTANNEGGSATNNLTTTSITPGANGLLFAADCDWNQSGNFEASSDLTQVTADYSGAISVCFGYKAVSNGVATGANLNAGGSSGCQHKWTQIIVRELAGGGGGGNPWFYYAQQ